MSKARELANLGNAYSDGALSNRNLVINGAMQVAQRGTSFTANGYTLDRWHLASNNTPPTVTQETGVFSLGGKSIKMVTDASNGYAYVGQKIEDLSFFSGKTITVSFDYKSTQDFYVGFEYHYGVGGSATDFNQNEVLVPAAATATRAVVTVTVPDLSAKTFGPSNTSFLQVFFNEVTNPSILEMTNVQLEVGDTATPFEHRSYGQELALCQRYYERLSAETDYSYIGVGVGASATIAQAHIAYQKKRAIPSLSGVGDFMLYSGYDATVSNVTFVHITSTRCTGYFYSTGLTVGRAYKAQFHAAGDRYIAIDAEL